MRSEFRISEFGNRLKKQRKACEYTQAVLAKKIDVTTKTLQAWERSKNKDNDSIAAKNVIALCNVLECDFDYLFGKQELPRKEATDVQTVTGLSPKAISVILKRNADGDVFRNTLSKMMEHPVFYDMVIGVAERKRYQSYDVALCAEVDGQEIGIGDLAKQVTRAGWAVLTSDGAARYWLQTAYSAFEDMARDIWAEEVSSGGTE